MALAQNDDATSQVPKPTIEDAQKIVQAVSSDKTKLQAYCELGKLQGQIEQAEEKNDTKVLEALGSKVDSLERQVGPDYAKLVDGLDEVDPNSAEGKKFAAVFDTLQEKCK